MRLSKARKANQTVIEGTDIGRAITQDLRRSGEWRAILRKPRYDRQTRFIMQSARFESGQVHVPQEAPWLNELLAFPNGRHDDQVDSTSQALGYLAARTHHRMRPRCQANVTSMSVGRRGFRERRARGKGIHESNGSGCAQKICRMPLCE